MLTRIVKPRAEEILEIVRDRLAASPFAGEPRGRVVLTGGASQLPGTRELAALILDKQIRSGRPLRIDGLAEAMAGPAFATSAGLVHFALSERAETPRRGRALTEEPGGLFVRVGHWIKENF